jgi:RNA polymerase sigma-70 factor (ECF subfamily)
VSNSREKASEESSVRSNQAWISALESRDEFAIKELLQSLQKALLAGLRGKIDTSLGEDIAQDATLKILSSLHTYRGDCQFLTWAKSIAMRTAFSELRRARWKDISLNTLSEGSAIVDPADDSAHPAATMDLANVLGKLRSLIHTLLTDRQRQIIFGELQGMPQSVLCERLQTNRNALYKLGHDARVKLKNGLIQLGISEVEVRSILAEASNR